MFRYLSDTIAHNTSHCTMPQFPVNVVIIHVCRKGVIVRCNEGSSQVINEKTKCVIQMTLTTYDEGLCKKIEPNVCTTKVRFEVLKELRRIGIPTVVWLCPILPFINDTEENIKGILNYCSEAEVYGIICFGMGLTLREGSREYFFRQLDHLFPGMKEKYLQTYGMQYQIVSNKNDELMQLFHHTCEKNGIVHDNRKIFEYLSTFETKCDNVQLSLFDKDFAGKSPNGI